jgi:hypothetical protein
MDDYEFPEDDAAVGFYGSCNRKRGSRGRFKASVRGRWTRSMAGLLARAEGLGERRCLTGETR